MLHDEVERIVNSRRPADDLSKIKQILPADGWYVNFLDGTSEKVEETHPLVCFALVAQPSRDIVLPMVIGPGGSANFCHPSSIVRVFHRSESADLGGQL